MHEGRNLLFVTERINNRLLVVNLTTFETVAPAQTGRQPWGVVINEDTNRVYVSNFGSGDVSIFDATTLDNEKLYAVYTDGAQWSVDIWKPVPGGVWGALWHGERW